MNLSFLFYDLETSGLNPCFDQVYQYAAIRTDLDLNPLEEIEYDVRPTRDIIPSPMAMVTHQLSLESLFKGECESKIIRQIHQAFNRPGTISLGYNTLNFDDEFLRFNFYRHLLTPYTHQHKEGCYRMDIFPMLVFYYLYRPDVLNWPLIEGKVSLKLENLSKANGLAEGQAHHAMVDVRATLALAKILKRESEIWNYLNGFFNKTIDQERYAQLSDISIAYKSYKYGILIDPKLGADKNFQTPVLCLGSHWHYRNQSCWLRLDQDLTQDAENLLTQTWVVNKKWGEGPFVLPLKPRFIKNQNAQALAEKNIAFFQSHPAIFEKIVSHYLDYKHPPQPHTDIDAALYQIGFMSSQDEFLCRQFHLADHAQKSHYKTQFSSPDIKMLSERYLGRFHYEHLSAKDRLKFDDYLAMVYHQETPCIFDYRKSEKLLRMPALREIEGLAQKQTFSDAQKGCLQNLKAYLENLGG